MSDNSVSLNFCHGSHSGEGCAGGREGKEEEMSTIPLELTKKIPMLKHQNLTLTEMNILD